MQRAVAVKTRFAKNGLAYFFTIKTNISNWLGKRLFHNCTHRELSKKNQWDKEWLDPNCDSFKALQTVDGRGGWRRIIQNVYRCVKGETISFHGFVLWRLVLFVEI